MADVNRGIIEMTADEMLVLSCELGIQKAELAFAEGVQPKGEPKAEKPSQVGGQKSHLYRARTY